MLSMHQPEIITEPIILEPSLADPQPGTAAYGMMEQRYASASSFGPMPWVPQGNDEWAQAIYDRIDDMERSLVAPKRVLVEYDKGTADVEDQVETVVGGAKGVNFLFTAEHATKTVRVSGDYYADTGTGGLAAVLAQDYGTGLIMCGRQTGNPPVDERHPIKDSMKVLLPRTAGFLSVHGMAKGKFVRPNDAAEVQAIIGLGLEPAEATRDLARRVVQAAHDLGVYAIIGNDQAYYIQKGTPAKGLSLKRDADGMAVTNKLAALRPTTTTNYARQLFAASGQAEAPALQVELTHLLRLTPEDWAKKDRKARVMGVALGYKVLESVVQLSREANASDQHNS